MKTCSVCGIPKEVEEFYLDRRNTKNGRQGSCKLCTKIRNREYQQKNQKERVLKNRAYMRARPGLDAKYQKAYRERNPEQHNVNQHKRRAAELGAIGTFTAKEWNDLLERYGHKCLCCGKTNITLSKDHVVPLAKGGSNFISNIQPLCRTCNGKKHVNIVDYRPNIVLLDVKQV